MTTKRTFPGATRYSDEEIETTFGIGSYDSGTGVLLAMAQQLKRERHALHKAAKFVEGVK